MKWVSVFSLIVILLITTPVLAEEEYKYPLVIYGGEPEGVMAAVAAARENTETLLLLKRKYPGGLMTYGGLNYLDINYGPDGQSLNRGLFAEWHNLVGGDISFNIEKAENAFETMLKKEKRITTFRNIELDQVIKNNGKIETVIIENNGQKQVIKGDIFIDASQDADLAVMADIPYFKGGGDIGLPDRHMAVTLVLHLGNIDLAGLKKDVTSQKFGPSYYKKDHAWGFVKVGDLYQPRNKLIKMRGLNIVIDRTNNNIEAYINSMLIFGIDPTDSNSLQKAYRDGMQEAEYVLEFLKENFAGFRYAELLNFPDELYIRESRHIVAKYQLKPADLLNNRTFDDTIAFGSYPLDYQASDPRYDGFVLFNPDIYGIPLRSLIPLNLDNMLVVGRSSGFSSLAAASTRVLPTGMSAGEAAGIAAALAIKNSKMPEELVGDNQAITYIQNKLDIRKLLDDFSTWTNSDFINNNEFKDSFEEFLSWGLIIGGYNNKFLLNDPITERDFAHLIVKGLKYRGAPILYEWVPGGLETMSTSNFLTRDSASLLLLVAVSKRVSKLNKEEFYPEAVKLGLISDGYKKDVKLLRKDAYQVLSTFLKKYPISEELQLYRGESNG